MTQLLAPINFGPCVDVSLEEVAKGGPVRKWLWDWPICRSCIRDKIALHTSSVCKDTTIPSPIPEIYFLCVRCGTRTNDATFGLAPAHPDFLLLTPYMYRRRELFHELWRNPGTSLRTDDLKKEMEELISLMEGEELAHAGMLPEYRIGETEELQLSPEQRSVMDIQASEDRALMEALAKALEIDSSITIEPRSSKEGE